MEYLHAKGCIHLNLKLGNLVVGFTDRQPVAKAGAGRGAKSHTAGWGWGAHEGGEWVSNPGAAPAQRLSCTIVESSRQVLAKGHRRPPVHLHLYHLVRPPAGLGKGFQGVAGGGVGVH